MPFVCACSCGTPKKKMHGKVKMDFRRADPQYVNFVPRTCMDAIDLFNRHRNLGLTADLYPECFVHCARALPEAELDKFHRFIICPDGDITKGGEQPSLVDVEIERERQLLLKEAKVRDLAALSIAEEKECPMSDSEEKSPMSISECPTDRMSVETPTDPESVDSFLQITSKSSVSPTPTDPESVDSYLKILTSY